MQATAKKHGISFEQASQIFRDPLHVSIRERVIDSEERWLTFGDVEQSGVLIVAHTVILEEYVEVIRIISARPATKTERHIYEEELD